MKKIIFCFDNYYWLNKFGPVLKLKAFISIKHVQMNGIALIVL